MYTRVLGLTTSAFILAYGAVGAMAQDQTHQPDQHPMQSHPMEHEGGDMMGHGMMGRGMMGPHGMMGAGGMAACSPIMFRMIFALVDSDGDGTIELPEFQAAHERIFRAMDTNKDGRLTPEEMEAFMHGK